MSAKLISRKRGMVLALDRALFALEQLDFEERRKVLRWVCDQYGIAPERLPLP